MISYIYSNFRVNSIDKNAFYVGKLGTFLFEANYMEILCIYDSTWKCSEPASLCSRGHRFPVSFSLSACFVKEYKIWQIYLIASIYSVLHELSLGLSQFRLHCNHISCIQSVKVG
jgi:hypothetical protein